MVLRISSVEEGVTVVVIVLCCATPFAERILPASVVVRVFTSQRPGFRLGDASRLHFGRKDCGGLPPRHDSYLLFKTSFLAEKFRKR